MNQLAADLADLASAEATDDRSNPEGSVLDAREMEAEGLFLRTIISEEDPALIFVNRLYHGAYPRGQRIPFSVITYAACNSEECTMVVLEDPAEGGPVGFAFLLNPDFADFHYALYQVVDPDIRGKGYGTVIIEKLKARANGRLALDIETTRDPSVKNFEQRKKRERFYIGRCGFQHAGFAIQHGESMYDVMACFDGITKEDVLKVNGWFEDWVSAVRKLEGPIYK